MDVEGDPFDPASIELRRPDPARPVVARWLDRGRPWVDWFGLRRLIAVAVTVLAVVAGGWWLLRSPAPSTEAGLPRAATTTATATNGAVAPTSGAAVGAATTTVAPTSLVIDVAGAVVRPGVYELPAGSRVHAALEAAGGAAADADLATVNLAAPLVDGAQVYVPVVGDAAARRCPTGSFAADHAVRSDRPQPGDRRGARRPAWHRPVHRPGDRGPPRGARSVRIGRRPRGGTRASGRRSSTRSGTW